MALVNDIVMRLYLNGDWRDVSTRVRAKRGINYVRGRQDEDDTTPPQRCSFDLDNVDGTWSDTNPLSPYYGHLRRNTPVELSLRTVKDTATTNASNGWGSTDAGTGDNAGAWQVEPWTVVGTTSNYAKSGGKATHSINVAGSTRTSYLANFRGREVDVSFTVQLSVTNVTGGALEQGIAIGNVMLRGQGAASTYYLLRLVVQTDETLTIDWWTHAGASIAAGAEAVTGITHVNTNVYRVRAMAEGRALRAKVWLDGTPEPYAWTTDTVDETESASDTMRDAQGWVGIQSAILTGCTNTNITVSYDDFEIRVPTWAGEISEWPQERDITGDEQTVSLVAQGVKRRLAQGNSLARSAIYSFTSNAGISGKLPHVYWPLEGGEQTGSDTLDVMGTTSRLTFNRPNGTNTVGRIKWGGDTTRPGSLRSPAITGGGALNGILEPPTDATAWAVQWQWKLNFREGTTGTFQTVALPGGGQITVVPNHLAGSNSVVVGLTMPGFSSSNVMSHTFDTDAEVEDWHTFAISAEQSGSDVAFFLYVDGEVSDNHTQAGMTLYGLTYAAFASLPDTTSDFAIGHVTIYSGDLTSWNWAGIEQAALGYPGETGVSRSWNLAVEYGVEFDWIADNDNLFFALDGKTMGGRRVAALSSLFDDCERIDGGLLYEQRSIVGLQFRTLESMTSRSPWVTLNVGTDKHLSPPLKATSDDRHIVNSATAQRVDGGEFTVTRTDGALAAVPAVEGGVGEYPKTLPFNCELEHDLPDLASWAVANGTVDQKRFPGVVVELHRPAVQDTAGLVSKLRDLDVGELISLAGLESSYIYDDPDTLVLGVSGYLDKLRHTLTLNTVPAEVYRTLVIGSTAADSSEFSRVDSDTTVIDEDLDTSETGVTIEIEAGSAFWVDSTNYAAHFPFDVIVGGEVMTVTACTTPTGQNQTMTVTRNVNGLPGGKSHTAGAKLSLHRPNYYGL